MSDEDYKIESGNVYESADLRDGGRRILVTSFYTGHANANIVSYPSKKNHRSINTKYLHQDRNTSKGARRKNGYFFVGKREQIEATAETSA